MINDIEPSTESLLFQPKSILKNTQSVPNLQAKTINSKKKDSKTPKKKVSGFVKNLSIQWNLLRLRLRSLSDDVFTSDEVVDELFASDDPDDLIDRLHKSHRGYTSNEENFLEEFKKHKSLEKMHENHERQMQSALRETTLIGTTASSDTQQGGNLSLEAVIRQFSETRSSSNTPSNNVHMRDGSLEDETPEPISFQDVDVCQLREVFDSQAKQTESSDNVTDTSKSTLHTNPDTKVNIGEELWEYRRSKWLAKTAEDELRGQQRLKDLSISHISKDSYVRIYNNLVDKGKLLRSDRRINLRDLITIINAGWIAEERWERAAKGLA